MKAMRVEMVCRVEEDKAKEEVARRTDEGERGGGSEEASIFEDPRKICELSGGVREGTNPYPAGGIAIGGSRCNYQFLQVLDGSVETYTSIYDSIDLTKAMVSKASNFGFGNGVPGGPGKYSIQKLVLYDKLASTKEELKKIKAEAEEMRAQ